MSLWRAHSGLASFCRRVDQSQKVLRHVRGFASRDAGPHEAGGFYTWYVRFAERRLPMILWPRFWAGMLPKFLRPGYRKEPKTPEQIARAKRWNPATFYIVMFLLLASHGIRMGALRNEYTTFDRKAERKIAQLKEVIEKIQKGEQVDVEAMLGSGDAEKEKEWEDVLREIEEDDRLWQIKTRRREARESKVAADDCT